MAIQEAELSTLNKRLEAKNLILIDLKEKSSTMTKRISELQFEVLSWKLSSYKDDGTKFTAISRSEKKSKLTDKDPNGSIVALDES